MRERGKVLSLATQQQQLMARDAVTRAPVHFVDTVAISACIGRDTLERMGPNLASASGTRPFSKGAYSSSFRMVCSCSVETLDRVQS